ncbi:MAG: aspartate/glutamate racemase family protein, partial [Desulfovibrionales bacterium]
MKELKTIGLLGGMSWESTIGYYRAINQGIKQTLGGLHSAKIVLYSVDFDPLEEHMREGDWDSIADELTAAARKIQSADADFLLLCTNTMHRVAPQIEEKIDIPFIHIADATAEVLKNANITSVGLLGTEFTMEQDFYKGMLVDKYGIQVVVPEPKEREFIHNSIFKELCQGKTSRDSKERYLQVIESLAAGGAEAVILGCTEIGMLIEQKDTGVPLFDTTAIHAQKGVEL